jgi:DNA-binding CsgD family transcriptional regulator
MVAGVGEGTPGLGSVPLATTAFGSLYADPPLSSILRQLLRHSRRLVGAMAGSVSLVDPARDRYAKMAEYGASCQLGRSFPLGDGVTGQVMDRRRPVVLASYGAVPAGHLPAGHPASRGAVAAVPIWWLGEVIGANVVFAGRRAQFTTTEVDELELLTQVSAAGIVRAGVGACRIDSSTEHRPATVPAPGWPVTPREHEVLALLGLGMSDREVAARLAISRKTAEKHVGALLRKTGTTSRTAAVMRALEWGWLSTGTDHGNVRAL